MWHNIQEDLHLYQHHHENLKQNCIYIYFFSPTEKDVNRTDRTLPFFAGENNVNLQLLSDILMTYVMYNFDLGYVQGMSDLLSPILFVMNDEVDAFWCFVGFMDKVVTFPLVMYLHVCFMFLESGHNHTDDNVREWIAIFNVLVQMNNENIISKGLCELVFCCVILFFSSCCFSSPCSSSFRHFCLMHFDE